MRRGVRKWITFACGVVACASFWLPFYRVNLAGARDPYELSGIESVRGILGAAGSRSGHGARDLFGAIIANSAGVNLPARIGLALYLVVGPALMAYFGIRYVLGALTRGRFSAFGTGIAITAYAATGWVVLRAMGEGVGMSPGFFGMTRTGFWVAVVALAAGGLIQEVTRD